MLYLTNHQGIFQSYYELTLLRDESSSRISWIGSIQAFLLIFTGIFTGPLFDLGYCKSMICAGALLIVFGTMMTSLCTEYWQFILAQGLVVGIGCGLSFIPSIALTPTYFSKKKGLANGICLSGSSFGTDDLQDSSTFEADEYAKGESSIPSSSTSYNHRLASAGPFVSLA